jgi:hypothetical protein
MEGKMVVNKNPGVNEDRDDLLAREIIQENSGNKDPELSLIRDFREEVDFRMEQVKVYYPIMDLLRKRKMENESEKFLPELGFLFLSYLIYEGKLKHKGVSFQEMEAFLAKAWDELLPGEAGPESIRELLTAILDGLQNGGRNFSINTYSLKSGSFRERFVKFFDIKQAEDGSLQYYLTEQGVDFYLRTKEFPEETKITINLLLFQKQMEKGAFSYAYETVRRLNMEVQKKKDHKYSLLEAVMYGRLDSGEAYNSYHQSIVRQFEEETELFKAALQNVSQAFGEYVERINSGAATAKEIRTFTLIKIIEKEIGWAQTLHTELLKEAVAFTGEYDQVLEMRRKAIFTERFDFQGELEKVVTAGREPEVLKFLFEPLLRPKVKKSFNPLSALEPQRLAKSGPETQEAESSGADADRVTFDTMIRDRVKGNFVIYAAQLLKELQQTEGSLYLQDFCERLVAQYGEDSVYNGDFISFIIELNRNKKPGEPVREIDFADGRLAADDELKTIEAVFTQAVLAARLTGQYRRVIVRSFPDQEVELLPGLKITKMEFSGVKQ